MSGKDSRASRAATASTWSFVVVQSTRLPSTSSSSSSEVKVPLGREQLSLSVIRRFALLSASACINFRFSWLSGVVTSSFSTSGLAWRRSHVSTLRYDCRTTAGDGSSGRRCNGADRRRLRRQRQMCIRDRWRPMTWSRARHRTVYFAPESTLDLDMAAASRARPEMTSCD